MAESVEVLVTASVLPKYAHPGDAGADLHAAEALELAPGARALVSTGVAIALPDGFVAFVVPRSGLAVKHGITVVNSPGTVDAGYRGEIKVALLNTDTQNSFPIAVGDRIAQLIVMNVTRATFIPVGHLPGSQRGTGGFGSTGVGAASAAPADEALPADAPSADAPSAHAPSAHAPSAHAPSATAHKTGGAL